MKNSAAGVGALSRLSIPPLTACHLHVLRRHRLILEFNGPCIRIGGADPRMAKTGLDTRVWPELVGDCARCRNRQQWGFWPLGRWLEGMEWLGNLEEPW